MKSPKSAPAKPPATKSAPATAPATKAAPAKAAPAKGEVLTARRLGRATLARQMLLAREQATAPQAIERSLGLQAQLARPPYVALWSRLDGFRREDLTGPVTRREIVRGTAMRGTLHLCAASDYAWVRPAVQPLLTKAMTATLRERAAGLDVPGVVAAARAYLAEGPRTFEEIRDHLTALGLPGDERARGFAVRCHVALVQVPDGGPWGYPSSSPFALADQWLGPAVNASEGDLARLVLRYLAGFGPASIADAQAWTGVASLKEAFAAVRSQLVTFQDERGRELFDLPGSPRPPEDTPAPVRFLPDFDNVMLAHDDRRRVLDDEHRPHLATKNLRVLPVFLVDGRVAGTWEIEKVKGAGTLSITPFIALSKGERAEVEEEGERLVRFVEPDAKRHALQWESRPDAKPSSKKRPAP